MNRSSLRFTPSLESLDERINPSASPLPVLMVLPNQDFYVAEVRTESPRTNGANFLMGDGSVRFLKEDLAGTGFLRSMDAGKPADPQQAAIVFVGGWGSSMYQYATQTPHVGGMLVGLGDGSVRGVKSDGGAGYSGTHLLYQDIPVPAASAVVFVGGWGSSMYQY